MNGRTASHGKSCFQVSAFAIAFAIVFALTLLTTPAIEAQTFSVLHNFTGGTDGANPYAGVTVGPGGVLYGTAPNGGGAGTVFRLSRVNSSWVFSPLDEFTANGSDGGNPYGGVVIGPNGALYGTASAGGSENDGTVFELRPPAAFCRSVLCYWNQTILHTFTSPPDGGFPLENLTFDPAGDIYGTTEYGGTNNAGAVFGLTPSGGGYTESILHSFGSGTDGQYPLSDVVLDTAGNVYGTTNEGGTGTECNLGCGTVYQLMPSNGGWVENVLVNFDNENGGYPYGNLTIDGSGNLYGTTAGGGRNGDGVVFKLAPSGGGFTYSALYSFSSPCGSRGGVAIDAAGNFFGTCWIGGAYGYGWVYELTNCSETCNVVDLHDFSRSDGAAPYGAPALDANGNLYGTTVIGGPDYDCGVVWEIAGVGSRH